MSKRKRPRRTNPARVGPIRSFANLYREPDGTGADSNSAQPSSVPKSRTVPGAEQPSEGVGLAYRVIEKYIDAGRSAAEQFSKQPSRTGTAARPLQQLVDRMLRSQAEMLPLWLDLFGSLGRIDSFRMANPPEVQATKNGSAVRGKVSIEVISRRPVEISVDVDPEATHSALVTPGLHALDKNKPGLTEIRFVSGNGNRHGKLCVKIPDRQPAGLYSGVIIDPKSGETRGSVSVRIADKPAY